MFWFYFLVLISLSEFSFSQDPNNCTECSEFYCPKEPCKFGKKENFRCYCCDECLKGPGESCGGFTPQPGVCASDLYCLPSNLSCQISDLPGTCVKDPSECEICRANYCCKIEETCGVLGSEKHPHCDCCTVCRRQGLCEFCGGIAAFPCADGLTCVFEGSFPDAGGICQKRIQGESCGGFVGNQCDEGFTCVGEGSFPDAGGICQKCSPCEFCGGIDGTECCDGLTCVLEGSYPDAAGICKKCSLGHFCGGIAGIKCDDGFTCGLGGSYPDAGGICQKDGLGEICGGKAGIEGCDGLTCVLDVSYPDAGGICQICE